MAFTYSSNVITQSGTDTDLKGLSGLTGVTVTTTNVQLAADRYDVYVINSSTQLKITGTLTIEPDIEMLIIEKEPESWGNGAPLLVTSGGVLNFGVSKTNAGQTIYSQGIGLQFTNQPANFFARDGMYIASGGTLNWNGGIMRTGCTLTIGDGGTCTVNDGTIYNSSTADNYQFRIEASNQTNSDLVNIYRLRYDGMSRPIRIFSTYSFGTLRPILARGQFSAFNSGSNQPITVENFDIAGNTATYDALFGVQDTSGGATMTFQNCSAIPNYDPFVTNATYGYYRVLRQMDASVVNLAGSGITYSYYGVDTNNGSRGVAPNGDDDTSDKVYSGINQTGNFDDNLLVSADRCVGNKVIVLDRRDDNGDGTGTIPIRFISYLETITLFEPTLIGLNSDTSRIVLLPDTLVGESNKSVVDAYTELNDSSEIYDRAKSYLVDNYSGEASLILTKEGSQVNIGATNLNIDGTASSAFAYSTDVTIKSSTFTAGVKGSGNVTVSNGALLNGGTFDAPVVYSSGPSTITSVTANSIDFTQAGTYVLSGCSLVDVTNSSGGTVILEIDPNTTISGTVGANITINRPRVGEITNLQAGSRIQIYNNTTSSEVYNDIVSGTTLTYNYSEGVGITSGDEIRIRATYSSASSAMLGFETITNSTSSGFLVRAAQVVDSVYNTMGVDGSTITIFEADYVDTEIDLIVSTNFGTTDLYPWWVDNLHTADGIRYFFGGIIAEDIANFKIDNNTIDLMFDTDVSTNVYQNNDARIYRSDSTYPVKAPTTGGGAIDLVWRQKVLVAEVNTSGLTAAESALLSDIANLPTAAQVRTEIDTNSTQLASIRTTVEDTNADVNAISIPTPPTAAQIRTEIDTNSTQLASIKTTVEDTNSDVNALPAPVSAIAIRQEIDTNSTQLASIKTTVEDTNADVNAISIPTPPTVQQIRTEIDTNSTQLSSIKTTVEDTNSDVNAISIPTPPTAAQIRTEMDTNSTQLSSIKATVEDTNSDVNAISIPTPPTATQIRQEMDTHSTKLDAINTTVNDIETDIANIPTAPTVQAIRQEMDTHSTKLDSINTTVNDIETDIANIPTAPTVEEIRTEIDANSTQLDSIKTTVEDTNADVNALPASPTATEIRQEIDSNSEKLESVNKLTKLIPAAL